MAGWPVRGVGLDTEVSLTPTLFQVEAGIVVTSWTTCAGAGVTGVYDRSCVLDFVALTMKRAAMITTTRPTAPQAM